MNRVQMLHMDCMDYMRGLPDNHFHIGIVDPEYGIDEGNGKNNSRGTKTTAKRISKKNPKGTGIASTQFKPKDWDKEPPPPEYFEELFRVTQNQIIWGANHFMDRVNKPSSCWIVWDKNNGGSDFADCELAYTSFKTAARMFKFTWNGMLQGDMKNKERRIHPTQKPVALYKWLLSKYAKPDMRILDTHLGSGSSAIAAHYFGCEFVGCEKDKDYFDDAVERFSLETAQVDIFQMTGS